MQPTELDMTDLEDRIRESLHDPRRQLPAWQDPMRRIRRAARWQRAGQAAGIGALVAVIAAAGIVPALALRPGTHTRPAPGGRTPSPGLSISMTSGAGGPSPPRWTKQLRGEVAYECGYSICLMRPDGTGRRTLSGPFPLWDAAWSPHGGRVAFRGYYGPGDGQYDLYAVDANGCHLARLTRGVNGASPSWSPTGGQIAFSVAGGGIDVISASGAGLHALTTPTSAYGDDAPAWSAGNRIAFVRSFHGRRFAEIYTMNTDGSGVTPLTHGAPGFGAPSWSPDGKSIAFVANPSAAAVIEVANADGTGAHRVSPPAWTSYNPSWTPDGKVVFLVKKGARTSAYIVNSAGTGLRLLYPNLDATQIAWGPTTLSQEGC
jgi:hypothetical protein